MSFIKSIIPALLLVSLLTACDKTLDDVLNPTDGEYKVYTIKKGQQYTFSTPSQVKTTNLKFTAIFDSSAIYTSIIPENQHDINKLYGFSDCGAEHHTQSARFGWRWSEDSLRLFAYCYINAVLVFKEMGTATIGAENNCEIKIDGARYIFTLNGKVDTMERGCTTVEGARYRLYPFFGGSENAPHDISIRIKEEK